MTMKKMKIFSQFVVGILLIISYPLVSHSQQGWFQQVSGTTLNLNSVYFIDANTGFVAADNGYILRTTNGGSNWSLINTGSGTKLYQILFVNSTTGFTGTLTNTIRTSDGGTTWNISINGGGTIMSFVDQNTGYALKYGSFYDTVSKTTNSGLNWTFVSQLGAPGLFIWTKIWFINLTTGYAGGSISTIHAAGSYIYKTTDSGNNWTSVHGNYGMYYAASYDIYFLNDMLGFSLDNVLNSYYFNKTTNAGQNWVIINIQQMNSVRFTDANNGWLCGPNGSILHTTNGGTNWVSQLSGVSVQLNELYMLNQNTGWIVGNSGIILKTTDGGPSGINPISNEVPQEYRLYQNYPNPFNPVTKIKFSIPPSKGVGGMNVRIVIYDLLGRGVTTLVNEQLKPGSYEVEWDGSYYPSGVYIYRLQTETFSETKKMILLK
jgi:photosystem II stability/assembly factor-like uncharacterized protein